MTPMTRRAAIQGGLSLAGALAISGVAARPASATGATESTAEPTPPIWFTHAVASGDPTADGVVLWTRAYPIDGRARVDLTWIVATDPALADVVATGPIMVTAATDWCAKAIPAGLEPHTTYWYGFVAGDGPTTAHSPIGRTRTAPAAGLPTERLRFVLVTCTNPEEGRLNTLARVAELDDSVDAVIHHGDYIYEYGRPGVGFAPDHTCVSLDDYRTRYAAYRSFPQLRDAHRMHPWIHLWDDGDIANGAWREGAADHDPDLHGTWADRRAAAFQAFTEWTPCRLTAEVGDTPVTRSIAYGDLAHLVVVDAMWNRDPGHDSAFVSFDAPELMDPARRIMSDEQEAWLADTLASPSARDARWTVLVTQALVTHWGAPGLPDVLPHELTEHFIRRDGNQLYSSAWNGYPAARGRLIDAIEAARLRNLVITSGDAHLSITGELTRDPYNPLAYDARTSRNSVGVELCCASVSSAAIAETLGVPPRTVSPALELTSVALNPHQRWLELDSKGYVLLELRPDRMVADYWFVDTVAQLSGRIDFAARLTSLDRSNRLQHELLPSHTTPRREVAEVPLESATNPVALDELGGGAAAEPTGNRVPTAAAVRGHDSSARS